MKYKKQTLQKTEGIDPRIKTLKNVLPRIRKEFKRVARLIGNASSKQIAQQNIYKIQLYPCATKISPTSSPPPNLSIYPKFDK